MDWRFERPGKSEYELACIRGVMTDQRVRECSWFAIQSREYGEQCSEYTRSRVDERGHSIRVGSPAGILCRS